MRICSIHYTGHAEKIKMKRRMIVVIVEASSIIDVTKHCPQIIIQAKLNQFVLAQIHLLVCVTYALGKRANTLLVLKYHIILI